jgi:S1-C subfamily serine protease
VTAGLVLLASGVGVGWGITRTGSPSVSSTDGSAGQADTGFDVSAIATKVEPAVVDINTFTTLTGGFPIGAGGVQPLGAGTGMIVTSSGQVLTNNHVIRGATSIRVTIQGRSGTYLADVVGADPAADVALLQIRDVSGLPTVSIANSNATVGRTVIAIGNAFGRAGVPSLTSGTVTAIHQTITAGDPGGEPERLSGLIESNASIAPGDSGGPLVGTDGRVLGMITAASRSMAFERASNDGFAIAIGDALSVVRQIRSGRATGDIVLGRPGMLGVQVRDVTPGAAARLGLGSSSGALVVGVVPDAPADSAGIAAGSVIVRVDGTAIDSADGLGTVLHAHHPGDRVRVTWVDASGTHGATVSLVTGPAV